MLLFLFALPTTAQSNKEVVVELSGLLKNRNRLSEVFYTEHTGILDINGNQIPVAQVNTYFDGSKTPLLIFQCISRTKINCIAKPIEDREFEILSIPIDDEESALRAIELIEMLK